MRRSAIHDVEFEILGPVQVMSGGQPVHLTGRQRALCAALLLELGKTVSLDRIVRRLWDERPPAAAAARVRSLVAELRGLLGRDGAAMLVTRSPGYLIDVDPEHVDLARFERHLAAAGQATGREPARALAEYERSLALWRGEPLTDLAWAPERQRLAELWVQAVEGRLESAIALGLRGGLIAELTRHAEEYPLREHPRALLMRALHEQGRTAEALEVYTSFRRSLIEELGIEPTAGLADLHRTLLAGAPPTLDAASRRGQIEPSVPHQLPAVTSLFVGRQAELQQLDQLRARGARVVMISGPAGAGKSTLALRWARTAADHFPDGQIFLDVRGFDRGETMTPREALPLLLQALGRPVSEIPPTLTGQVALYRTMVANRRILIVLDDVARRAQIQDLLPGGDSSLTVITTRNRMSGLAATTGAQRVNCDVLDPAVSMALLRLALGSDRISAEPEAAARLAELCDHLPLALCVAVSQIGEDASGTIGNFVARLLDRGRLAQLSIDGEEHAAVRAALDASYEMLPPAGRLVHRSIGLLPGTCRSVAAIAAAVNLQRDEVDNALAAAVRLHLVRPHGPTAVAWHDLVQEHAIERLRAEMSEAESAAATGRLLEHYLRSAVAAARACGLAGPEALPGIDAPAITFADPAAAHAWFDGTWPETAAAISHVAVHGPRRYAWLLVDSLNPLIQHRRPPSDLVRITEIGLRAAEAENDMPGQAAMQVRLGQAAWRAGDLPAALAAFRSGGHFAREVKWRVTEARSEQGIGVVLKMMGEPERALSHYRRAALTYRDTGDELGESGALNNLGSALLLLARLGEAEEALAAALPLAARSDPHLHSLVLVNLGEVRIYRGQFDDALIVLDEALHIAVTAPSAYARTVILENVGLAQLHRGDFETARAALTEALGLARQVENRTSETAVLISLADVAIGQGRHEEAEQYLTIAGRITSQIGVAAAQSATLRSEGSLLLALDRPQEALGRLRRAAALAAAGSPLLLPAVQLLEAQALARLGEVQAALSMAGEAGRLAQESGQLAIGARAIELAFGLVLGAARREPA